METVEIPRFLLDYFDSATIRTPLTCIQGYAEVMLKEIPGPLTDDQKHFLEIIRQTAEQLNKHFSLVIHNQHYLAWDQYIFPGEYNIREIVSDFLEAIHPSPRVTVTTEVADNTLPVWVDKRHLHNAFGSIAEFFSQICDENKGAEIVLRISDKNGFVTFEIETNKKENLSKRDLSYFQSYLFVAQRVIELHNGNFILQDVSPEKLRINLVFPNRPKASSL